MKFVARFFLPVTPTPKGRPRVGKTRTVTPERTKKAQRAVVFHAARHAPPSPIVGPVGVSLIFVMALPPKHAADLPGSPHVAKPDLDNLTKLVLDALSKAKTWWGDDCQVWNMVPPHLKRYQRDGEAVGIWVEVTGDYE